MKIGYDLVVCVPPLIIKENRWIAWGWKLAES
jgi:hypothetical protein